MSLSEKFVDVTLPVASLFVPWSVFMKWLREPSVIRCYTFIPKSALTVKRVYRNVRWKQSSTKTMFQKSGCRLWNWSAVLEWISTPMNMVGPKRGARLWQHARPTIRPIPRIGGSINLISGGRSSNSDRHQL